MNHSKNSIYGVINSEGIHIDVSKSLRGTKSYATKNGYNQISIRYNSSYIVKVIFEKKNGKWEKY